MFSLLGWRPSQRKRILMCKLDVLYSFKQLMTWYKWRLVLFLRELGASSLLQVLQRTSWVRIWSENDSAVSWSPLGRVSSGQCSDGSVRTQNGLQLVCLFCLFGSHARMCWQTGDTRRNNFIQGGFAVNMYLCVCGLSVCLYEHYIQPSLWVKRLLKHAVSNHLLTVRRSVTPLWTSHVPVCFEAPDCLMISPFLKTSC